MSPPRRSALDRALAAYPLVVAYLVLLTLYAWQTTRVPSPWIFTDELQWSLLSRGVAHTGHPELREHAARVYSLYPYFLAPAWWAKTTGSGYADAKYLNAIVMTATLFPGYGLARLFVARWGAVLAAVATAAIPSLALSGVLMPESLAYFWSALTLWLVARALLRPARASIAFAVAALVVAPFVRGQLEVLIGAALVAALVLGASSERARRTYRTWHTGDLVGAALLALGIVIAGDVFVAHHAYEWYIGTHFWHRAFTYGLWAFGALTIGVGVLPVLLSIAWLLGRPTETREDRVLLGILVGSVLAFGVYTGVKASYLSTVFSVRVEERNLIYLSPIAFVVAARWLAARQLRVVPLLLGAAATGWLLWSTPYYAYAHLYSDAFGLSIMQWFNQHLAFTIDDLRILLFAILAVGVVLALFIRRAPVRVVAGVGVALAALTVAWNLTGEISAANQAIPSGKQQLAQIPSPPNWIDRETGGARTLFIGAALQNSDPFWTLEFWNSSLQDVWSVDATAPPPGPSTTPNFRNTDGLLDPQLPDDWVAAQPVVTMVGRIAEEAGGLDLYRVPRPIHMRSLVTGLTADGWMQQQTTYVRFAPRPTKGTLTISISRGAACGSTIPTSEFSFRVAHLGVTPEPQAQPVSRAPETAVRVAVPNCVDRTLHLHVTAPLRVAATADHPFRSSDGRMLSAFVSYAFAPTAR